VEEAVQVEVQVEAVHVKAVQVEEAV
jgi:hypothetical protein